MSRSSIAGSEPCAPASSIKPRTCASKNVEVPQLTPNGVLVRVRAAGICGSDLHYYFEGKNGDFVIREPLIPGHELAGEVEEIGAGVNRIRPGMRVAVHPGRNCGDCPACRAGRGNLCRNVFFMGSCSRFPHMQGGFADYVLVNESQCYPVARDLPFSTASFAEPLAVALHAVERAGSLLGRSVLVVGAGPIGLLVLLAARRAGAERICITDILDGPLTLAGRLGADGSVAISWPRTCGGRRSSERFRQAVSSSAAR